VERHDPSVRSLEVWSELAVQQAPDRRPEHVVVAREGGHGASVTRCSAGSAARQAAPRSVPDGRGAR
jgi:hypothetical protein